MNFSSLPGTLVLSPAGEELGYVLAAFVSLRPFGLTSLVCADAEEEEFILPARAVRSCKDAIIAGNGRLNSPAGVPCPVGRPAYDERGAFLGRVAELSEHGELALSDGTALRAENIAAGEAVVVYPAGKLPPAGVKKTAAKRATARKNEERVEKTAPAEEKTPPREENALSAADLLGKRVKKPLLGGELASAGDVVTPEVLQRARRSNRLVELAASTLTE